MSEYIVEVNDHPTIKQEGWNARCDDLFIQHEEIVRCRDCRFADWDITAWWCTRDKHNPFKIGELRGYCERSQLGGFCAWSERRGDA